MKHRGNIRTTCGGLRRSSRGGTLVGVFIGIVLGVMVAALAVWFMNNKVPSPFSTKPPAQQIAGGPQANAGADDANQPLQGKPGDPPAKRFEFYDILPGTEKGGRGGDRRPPDTAPVPDTPSSSSPQSREKEEKGGKTEAPSSEKAATAAPEQAPAVVIYMQAGSFQDSADADNQKAKLALLGVEANVLQVMVQDKVWYRVRIGPFARTEEASRVRADLAKQGIQAVLLR